MYFFILLFLWGFRSLKAELFWLYLFQLKEYKIKRFLDHFRTEKGKRLLADKLLILKISLAASYPFFLIGYLDIALFLIYLIEAGFIVRAFAVKNIKKPVITSKSIPLIAITALLTIVFGVLAYLYAPTLDILAGLLLAFDIWLPVIILMIVSFLRPVNRYLKNRIIKEAKAKRLKLKNLLVIGITGSYGKTSTKEFLYEILKDKFNVIRTPEHVNTEIGASKFIIDKLNAKHEIFICEMGAYEKGEVKETADIVVPQIGVFLGANEQHLSLFGRMENLLKAEGGEELLEALKKNSAESPRGMGALGIFNGNNIYAYELWKRADIPKRITYVPNLIEIINPEKRDVRAENIRVERDHITFKVLTNKNSKGVDFRANLLGAHNIENILLCIALGESLGLTLEEMKKSVKEIIPLPRTMSLTKNRDEINIINSTYSSNPSAVIAHLEYLKSWGKAKKIVIMPCLIELGSASATIHERIGRELARIANIVIVTTYDRFNNLLEGAESIIGAHAAKEKIFFIEDSDAVMRKVSEVAEKGDVILLEGRIQKELVEKLEK